MPHLHTESTAQTFDSLATARPTPMWQAWTVGAASAFFGVPYMNAETAPAAWLGVKDIFKALNPRHLTS